MLNIPNLTSSLDIVANRVQMKFAVFFLADKFDYRSLLQSSCNFNEIRYLIFKKLLVFLPRNTKKKERYDCPTLLLF